MKRISLTVIFCISYCFSSLGQGIERMKIIPNSSPENPKYPESAFAIYNGRLYYHGCDSILRCYDLTGQLQWKQNIDTKGQYLTFYDVFILAPTIQKGTKGYGRFALSDGHYNHSTPILNMTTPPEAIGGYIYYNSLFEDGGFCAYDPATDSIIWKTFVANELETPPLYTSRVAFLRKDKNNITALNLKNGKPMFQKAQHKIHYPVVTSKTYAIGSEGMSFTVIDNRNFDRIEWKKNLK
ncbi:MAG: PQQ-like beta-propeller repeat protein, partial [Bacteroidia bacterium]|nr:PQQ-like beta-propeller repeat protein [Bacteroidia bacterium]